MPKALDARLEPLSRDVQLVLANDLSTPARTLKVLQAADRLQRFFAGWRDAAAAAAVAHGLTQAQVGAAIGISQPAVSQLIRRRARAKGLDPGEIVAASRTNRSRGS